MKMAKSKGFSLPELLVVMFIISSLAAGTYVLMQIVRTKGQVTKAITDIKEISGSMAAFYDDTGVWPGTAADGAHLGILDLSGTGPNFPAAGAVIPEDVLSAQGNLYANVPNNTWDGPYLTIPSDAANVNPVPMNPWKGYYDTVLNCNNNPDAPMVGFSQDISVAGCEYGVVMTEVPRKAAEAIDQKLDGTKDNKNGTLVYECGGNGTPGGLVLTAPLAESANPTRCVVYKFTGQE